MKWLERNEVIYRNADRAADAGEIGRWIDPLREIPGEIGHRAALAVVEPLAEILLIFRRLGGSDADQIEAQFAGLGLNSAGDFVRARLGHSSPLPQLIMNVAGQERFQ